jgi:hypothetical protein
MNGNMIKKLWILIGRLWYNQVQMNNAKGYITFQKFNVANQLQREVERLKEGL